MSASASRITESGVEQTTSGYAVAFTPYIPPHKHHNHNQLPPEANNP